MSQSGKTCHQKENCHLLAPLPREGLLKVFLVDRCQSFFLFVPQESHIEAGLATFLGGNQSGKTGHQEVNCNLLAPLAQESTCFVRKRTQLCVMINSFSPLLL